MLDIGCAARASGARRWRSLRPGIEYLGLDSSEYAIARYGRSRNLRLADVRPACRTPLRDDIRPDRVHGTCCTTVRTPELKRGLPGIVEMLDGVAFLELFTAADAPDRRQTRLHRARAALVLSVDVRAGRTYRVRNPLPHRPAPEGLRRGAGKHRAGLRSSRVGLKSDRGARIIAWSAGSASQFQGVRR